MGMMDALLGGERDPLNLLKSFASGAATGLVVGALFGGISALANLGCTAAKISVMLKLALTGVGVIGGGISTIQSFSDGKIAQGIFRGINTGIGAYGLKKCFGSAVKTFKSCESGSETSKYQKANLWERITKRKAGVNELKANPLDEFSNPKIGPCESAVSKYIKQINQIGKLTDPIEVQKLTNGGYEIVNGHHRWLAAMRAGLKKVPIRIKNYSN